MAKKYFTWMAVISFSFFMVLNCAGSRDEGEGDLISDDQQQQKELDDIEALLGISTDSGSDPVQNEEPEQQQPKQEDNAPAEEQLNLLDTSERIDSSQPAELTSQEKRELERKINRLEEQVRQKDMTIADLNAKVTLQESSPNRSSSSLGSMSIISDISMQEYQSRYDEGRMEFENRNYEAAIQLFESLLSASSSHSLSDNAQYWIGESHYALRQYDAAIIDFEKVFTFTNSNKKADAQYKLGLCYMRKGDKVKAREEFDRLIRNFPNSNYSAKAQNLLSQI